MAFEENVVTCGLDSYVIVWNPWDGRKMIAIKEAHTKSVHAEVIPIEITAATFDPTFQRLITGAGDGTLKIWNFNSGTCLRNMKIQNNAEVKRIIWLKNRILAMGWNRRVTEFADSADVFGSSSDFCKNWDLRHSEDLSAAAVRVPQTLVTGTYDGEIMLWRLETGQPYKHYNVSDPTTRIKIKYKLDKKDEVKGPSAAGAAVAQGRKSVIPGLARPSTTHAIGKAAPSPAAQAASMRSRKVSMVAMPEQCLPLRKLAVHYMMFLNSRPMDPTIGTLLVSLENGSIQVWSHDIRGGFMTSFSGIHKAGDYVISMETDENNEFLFTGTSIGYIKTWLIKNYCNNRDDEHINMPKYRLMFPFMWGGFFLGRAERMAKNQFKPLLLSSFKGHVMAVSALVYINEAKILLSSSVDYTVRMWTLGGQYLQTLGTFKPWKQVYQNPQDNADFDHNVPPDICRVASSTTMRVMKGGGTLRTMSLKQLQAKVEKELTHVDQTKIYGSRLDKPILGHYYRPTMKTSEIREVQFDSTYPYIPVYQHLKMVSPSAEVQMPKQHAEHLDVKDSRRDEKKKAPP